MNRFLNFFAILWLFSSMLMLFSCRKEYSCKCGNAINTYDKRLTKMQAEDKKEKCESQPGCEFIKGNGSR